MFLTRRIARPYLRHDGALLIVLSDPFTSFNSIPFAVCFPCTYERYVCFLKHPRAIATIDDLVGDFRKHFIILAIV